MKRIVSFSILYRIVSPAASCTVIPIIINGTFSILYRIVSPATPSRAEIPSVSPTFQYPLPDRLSCHLDLPVAQRIRDLGFQYPLPDRLSCHTIPHANYHMEKSFSILYRIVSPATARASSKSTATRSFSILYRIVSPATP